MRRHQHPIARQWIEPAMRVLIEIPWFHLSFILSALFISISEWMLLLLPPPIFPHPQFAVPIGTSERHGVRWFAERCIGLVTRQMSPQSICERKLALLLGQGNSPLLGLDGLRKEARFRVGCGQRVENCGVLSSGKLLGPGGQSDSLSTIADRGVG